MRDDVRRSLKLNRDLARLVEKALKVDQAIKIGWNRAGDEIPKIGEMGIGPALPKGGRVRLLGTLADAVATLGRGGAFTLVGKAGDYFGAWNNGSSLAVERSAGSHVGYSMSAGRIIIRDGAGDDVGSAMSGGLLIARGDVGRRIGGGMRGGTIVVHGDVGGEPGSGMQGGRIIINGRCPSPGEGVDLKTLSPDELMALNQEIEDSSLEVPSDALCLVPAKNAPLNPAQPPQRSNGDWSSIGLVPGDLNDAALNKHATLDTLVLIGDRQSGEEEIESSPIGLPLPLIPMLDSGKGLKGRHLSTQPCLVRREPRGIDLLFIDSENIFEAPDHLPGCGGLVLDISSLPPMAPPALDGLLVSLRSMVGESAPYLLLGDISSVERLHVAAAGAEVDGVIVRVADPSGLPASASLPKAGRSAASAQLKERNISLGYSIDWEVCGLDIGISCAAGSNFTIAMPPAEAASAAKLDTWLDGLHTSLRGEMVRLGCDSVEKLERRHLRALDHVTASISGLRLAGYGRPLPHWFAS